MSSSSINHADLREAKEWFQQKMIDAENESKSLMFAVWWVRDQHIHIARTTSGMHQEDFDRAVALLKRELDAQKEETPKYEPLPEVSIGELLGLKGDGERDV